MTAVLSACPHCLSHNVTAAHSLWGNVPAEQASLQALNLRGTNACMPLPLHSGGSSHVIRARVCHNATDGFVAMEFNDAVERALLLRIGGPHVQTVGFQRSPGSSNGTWLARFRLCFGGRYTAHVRLVAENIWSRYPFPCALHGEPSSLLVDGYAWQVSEPTNHRSCIGGLWHWRANESAMAASERAEYPSSFKCRSTPASNESTVVSFVEPAKCSPTETRPVSELAIVDGNSSKSLSDQCLFRAESILRNVCGVKPNASQHEAQASLERIALTGNWGVGAKRSHPVFSPSHRWASSLDASFAGLVRAPPRGTAANSRHPTRWRSLLAKHPSTCLCVLGDSGMRYAVNAIVQRGGDASCNSFAYHYSHSAPCPADDVAFVEVRFGLEYFFDSANLTSAQLAKLANGEHRCGACAAVVLNFGRWALAGHGGTAHHSHHAPQAPWPLELYATRALANLKWLKAFGARNDVPVAFISTEPYPLHADGRQTACPFKLGLGVYMPYFMSAALNDIAEAVALALGVEFLNAWSIQLDLLELTWDGAHHDGPAVMALAEAIEAWVARRLHEARRD